MSMHKIPLTTEEEAGLRAHGLKVGTPSQLSDAFRQGVAWGCDKMRAEVARLTAELAACRPVPAAQAVPEGYVLMPNDPTPEMLRDGEYMTNHNCDARTIGQIYRAMLAASPSPVPAEKTVPMIKDLQDGNAKLQAEVARLTAEHKKLYDEKGELLLGMESLGWPCRLVELPQYVRELQLELAKYV